MSNDSQRGLSIDTGRQKRRRIGLGIGAAVLVAIVAIVIVSATGGSSDADAKAFGTNLKIGFNSAFASEERLLDYVAEEVAPDYGLTIESVSLGDPVQIDTAVSDGTLAASTFEHKEWMQLSNEQGGLQLYAALPIFKWAFAVYSDKYTDISQLPDGATIGVPDDPSNQAQALWLLEREGLITLKEGVDPWVAQLPDVEDNPHNFDLKPLGLSVMPRSLSSIDAGISYVDFFDSADVPNTKEILSTPPPAQFDGQLVIGESHLEDPNIQKLIETWEDPRIQEYLAADGAPALFPVDAQS